MESNRRSHTALSPISFSDDVRHSLSNVFKAYIPPSQRQTTTSSGDLNVAKILARHKKLASTGVVVVVVVVVAPCPIR